MSRFFIEGCFFQSHTGSDVVWIYILRLKKLLLDTVAVIIRTQVFQKHVTLLCFISINSNTGPHMIYLQKSGKFDTANKSETVSFGLFFVCVCELCSVLSDCRDNKASEQKQVHGLLSAAPLMLHHQGPVLNLPGLNNSQSHSNRWTDIKQCSLLWAAAAPFITTSSSMLPQLDVRCSYR